MFNVPILFLIFNRPDTTEKVFDVIKKIKPSKLFIAADGPRTEEEKELCEQTRQHVVQNIDWECEVKTLFRSKNKGLKPAVSEAITWFFENVEEGIILEDDTVPTLSFFEYCKQMLEKYRYDERIMCISGETVLERNPKESYFFSNIPLIWGWATWRRAWNLYDYEMNDFEDFIEKKKIKQLFKNSYHQRDWIKMLTKVKNGGINSWGYTWTYSVFKNQGLCTVPNSNMISNIGYDDRASHTFDPNSPLANREKYELESAIIHPEKIQVDADMQKYLCTVRFSLPPHFSLSRYEFFRQKKFIREIKRALYKMGIKN